MGSTVGLLSLTINVVGQKVASGQSQTTLDIADEPHKKKIGVGTSNNELTALHSLSVSKQAAGQSAISPTISYVIAALRSVANKRSSVTANLMISAGGHKVGIGTSNLMLSLSSRTQSTKSVAGASSVNPQISVSLTGYESGWLESAQAGTTWTQTSDDAQWSDDAPPENTWSNS